MVGSAENIAEVPQAEPSPSWPKLDLSVVVPIEVLGELVGKVHELIGEANELNLDVEPFLRELVVARRASQRGQNALASNLIGLVHAEIAREILFLKASDSFEESHSLEPNGTCLGEGRMDGPPLPRPRIKHLALWSFLLH